jgi:hypothetical protein
VLSSDRHTVKPWFQGKLPFSFNLPEGLPSDTTLDGPNLTYLHNRPVAQLLYSIGRHRVSVFVQQSNGGAIPTGLSAEHAGFHVASFSTDDLDVVAVSDVDPARLSNLLTAIEHANGSSQAAKLTTTCTRLQPSDPSIRSPEDACLLTTFATHSTTTTPPKHHIYDPYFSKNPGNPPISWS